MPWEADAPLAALDGAAFTYQHIAGADAAIRWHERELARLKACRAIVTKRREDAIPPAAAAPVVDMEWNDKTVAALTDAVNFYGRRDIYKARKGDKPAVMVDGGEKARETIQDVYGDEGNGARNEPA